MNSPREEGRMNEREIDWLNELIEVTIDSADGYREAAKEAHNPAFRQLFEERATARGQIVRVLQEKVRSLGGAPEDEGSLLASAHRLFVNLRNTVTGGDDRAVIEEVERGEDHIKEKYEEALGDASLSPELRATLSTAYQSIKTDHDRMAALKHGIAQA
jgi:uncharacterized protein (TIGR02284 family)